MSELDKKLRNSIKILYKVNSNLSEAFVFSMFKTKTKRYRIKDAAQKYSNKNKIEYFAYKKNSMKVYVMGTILTQTHLDILSILMQKIVYVKEKKSYIVETSISEIARKTKIKRDTVSAYLDDLAVATLKVITNNMLFTCKIIHNTLYVRKGKKIERIGIIFDPVFVLYFLYKINTFRLPETVQNTILELKTGIAKALARYCYIKRHIKMSIWDILREIDEEYSNLKSSQKRKIRYTLKKDVDTLKKLNITIEDDIVTFKNPTLLEENDKLKIFVNNNTALISFIDYNISELTSQP